MNELEQVQVAVFSVTVGTMSIRHYLKPISGLPMALYQAFSPQRSSLAVLKRGRPGKTESRGMTYLDMWKSGTFPEKQQVGTLLIANTDRAK